MIRQFVQISLLTGTLLMGLVPLAMAGPGVVATVTAADPKTNMATLTTEAGEVFTMPQETLWTVGSKVECERMDPARPRLLNCQPW